MPEAPGCGSGRLAGYRATVRARAVGDAGRAAVVATCLALATIQRVAWAAPVVGAPPSPDGAEGSAAVTVRGSCPGADAVWTAVTSIVPVKDLARLSSAARIEVWDLGDSYRVTVGAGGTERLRIYRDTARDCDHRARFAAVFIVLTLMPPDVVLDAPPETPPAPPRPPPPAAAERPVVAPPPEPVRARRLELEVAALSDFAPALFRAPETGLFGAELRFAAGGSRLALTGAAGASPHGAFDVAGLRVAELRFPFDLGLRLGLARARAVALGAEVGVAGAVFHLSADGIAGAQAATRLEVGGRVGLTARFGGARARLAPRVGIHVCAYPRPYELTLIPAGTLGRTPALWIGATAGVAIVP